jgi:sulfate permease, SulP family
MPTRYRELNYAIRLIKIRPFAALRQALKAGYSKKDFRSDLGAGLIVGMVAIPLGMALAIATGVPPQYGLYTVIIAGTIVGLLGGSRCQVSGPTAAFVVILAPIVTKYGMAGLLISGLIAGVILVGLGVARMGRLIQYIPHPVTTGFTAGIAVVIATIQLKDFFGLTLSRNPESYFDRVNLLGHAITSIRPAETAVGVFTLLGLIFWPRLNRKMPAPIVILTGVTVLVAAVNSFFPDLNISTIGSTFSTIIGGDVVKGIPQMLPSWGAPWTFPGPNGVPVQPSVEMFETLLSSGFAIAMLAAIESLLSAVVADGLAGTQHDPDAELIAIGVGNLLCPFFGGIPATGAIARTATNIRFGARSPIASAIHGIFVLCVVWFFAPYVSYLPMASLAALLLMVAYGMSDIKNFKHILEVAPRSDASVLLICFGLTVAFDMVIGVSVGLGLAALLFLRRMAVLTEGTILMPGQHPSLQNITLPSDVLLYEIAGPMFFGAAQRAVGSLNAINDDVKTVILSLEKVPIMDMTGLVALENTIQRLEASKRNAILVGVHGQAKVLIQKSEILQKSKVYRSIDEALAVRAKT